MTNNRRNYPRGYKMTKAEVDAELSSMKARGERVVVGEMSTYLYKGIQAHYGGFQKAKEAWDLPTGLRREFRPDMSRDSILREVIEIMPNIKSKSDFSSRFRSLEHRIKQVYGTLRIFEEETGIKFPKPKRKPRESGFSKYSDELLSEFVRKAIVENLSSYQIINSGSESEKRLLGACKKRWGSWGEALVAHGSKPKDTYIRHSDESLKETYLTERRAGMLREQVTSYTTLITRFGSLDVLNNMVGFKEPERYKPRLLTTGEVDDVITTILGHETRPITNDLLLDHNPDIVYSLRQHYGNTQNYFTNNPAIDYFSVPLVPFEWTKEGVIRHLKRWIREGQAVNYVAVAHDRSGIIKASRRLFGGWKYVFEEIGLDYEAFRVDTDMASAYGFKFENLVEEVVEELGVEYLREPSINGCHPDFVFGDHWMDAKLSEWTYRAPDCTTLDKYEPNCERLTIVYLRGYDDGVVTHKISDKTTAINVSELIKLLPIGKQAQYYGKATQLKTELLSKAS